MKIGIKSNTVILMVTFVSTAFGDSPFYLGGGAIGPRSSLSLKFKDHGIRTNWYYYDVTCIIENPNYYRQHPVVINVPEGRTTSVNNKSTIHGNAKLDKLVNTYEARELRPSDSHYPTERPAELFFQNFDSVDSVTVKDCYATYSVN
ncbi:MAG: hypothetical protein ACD_44C00096G0002 [uncultured bacterium]|nr:MAG: hypothetical protein ACD_44C00096G0002 [uncultured bacterium]OGT16881.1 MAG: hypothetical protein A3B69_01210 [Gammaproteobacteria bacterium RIFCSPHIGHO2_02_FULL_38_33]OGT24836.1 MAG: hypothetical protein A2W47_07640 [Gammaproteobacteria bacterium RIFCSPHIGHO2_12_38_15]OGT75383.1 MAG: hypothetical protein A3G71_02940 [Gammaproteobacteria bacterium RIFCSPLOWO2_12_FULL_38_14]